MKSSDPFVTRIWMLKMGSPSVTSDLENQKNVTISLFFLITYVMCTGVAMSNFKYLNDYVTMALL